MDYGVYSKLKAEATDFIRSTGKFKTPNNITEHGDVWYGTGVIIWFESVTEEDKIIAFLDQKGEVHYLNVTELETKLKEG